MENQANTNEAEARHDLFVRVKKTKSPKHLNLKGIKDKIKMLAVEVSETETEDSESVEVNIHFQSSGGAN